MDNQYDIPISIDWCSLRHALKVAFKYLIHGAVIALSIRYFPAYGQLMDTQELVTIAVISAVTMFVSNRVIPDSIMLDLDI